MTTETGLNRRQLLRAALIAPVALAGCATTGDTGEQRLRAEDPVARSLLYVPDTTKVPAGNPLAARHEPTQRCAHGIQVRGKAGETWRPCPTVPARLVNANGWCSVWAPG